MQLVTDQPGQPPIVWEWMHRKVKLPWSSDLRCMAAMREDGTIASAVAYNAWTENACWMHVAFDGSHGLTRALWRAAFEYPFIHCGKDAVYGLTPKHLPEALAMNRKLGFRQIAETVDCIMFEMKSDECRWIKENAHGRKIVSTAAA
jgi:hypothetical protein